jgi:hypothetical protein
MEIYIIGLILVEFGFIGGWLLSRRKERSQWVSNEYKHEMCFTTSMDGFEAGLQTPQEFLITSIQYGRGEIKLR